MEVGNNAQKAKFAQITFNGFVASESIGYETPLL